MCFGLFEDSGCDIIPFELLARVTTLEEKLHMAQLLIENKARLDARNNKQETALEIFLWQIASRGITGESRKQKDIVHLLVSSGAQVKFR